MDTNEKHINFYEECQKEINDMDAVKKDKKKVPKKKVATKVAEDEGSEPDFKDNKVAKIQQLDISEDDSVDSNERHIAFYKQCT